MSGETQLSGPDLSQGIPLADLPDGGQVVGHTGGEAVLVVRRGEEIFAIGAMCTHYGGPLGEGLVVHDTVRCPWHHACFSLRTGEAVRAPALNPVVLPRGP
jgi:apoptosis-inducing factor 3